MHRWQMVRELHVVAT